MTTCKNCNHHFEGNYCNQCRQSVHVDRITWAEVAQQVRHATVDIDRGYIYTVWELFVRPGQTIRNYLEGKRVNYANPFFYVLLTAGFASLLFLSFDVPLPVRSINLENIERMSPLAAQKYFIMVGLCVMGLLTLGDWLLQRKGPYNVAEMVVANSFQAGQGLVITVLMFPLIYLQDHFAPATSTWTDVRFLLKIFIFVYLVTVRYQLFSVNARSKFVSLALILIQVIAAIVIYELEIARLIMVMIQA